MKEFSTAEPSFPEERVNTLLDRQILQQFAYLSSMRFHSG